MIRAAAGNRWNFPAARNGLTMGRGGAHGAEWADNGTGAAAPERERAVLYRLRDMIRDFFQQTDLVLLGLCVVSSGFGLALIYSATRYRGGNRSVVVQAAALGLGIIAYLLMSRVDLELLLSRWQLIVVFNVTLILLLLTPLGIGEEEVGNTAWLRIPGLPVNIGPAEVVKITYILLLARQLAWLRERDWELRTFSAAFLAAGHAIGLTALYVVVSHDMGNGLVFFFIFLCMAFAAGFALRWFILLFAAAGAAGAAAWRLDLIPSYQKERFLVIFDHSYDPLGKGWHQTRSMLAIGSGGVFGQGYMNGTQTQSLSRAALPERYTDFIFSVCGEELGMVGCIVIALLLLAVILRVLHVAKKASSPFYACVCVGMASMLMFQTIINIGMCLFVMPVIGITLPFFSYGGSSLLTLFAAMGVVSGIKMRSMTSLQRDGVLR